MALPEVVILDGSGELLAPTALPLLEQRLLNASNFPNWRAGIYRVALAPLTATCCLLEEGAMLRSGFYSNDVVLLRPMERGSGARACVRVRVRPEVDEEEDEAEAELVPGTGTADEGEREAAATLRAAVAEATEAVGAWADADTVAISPLTAAAVGVRAGDLLRMLTPAEESAMESVAFDVVGELGAGSRLAVSATAPTASTAPAAPHERLMGTFLQPYFGLLTEPERSAIRAKLSHIGASSMAEYAIGSRCRHRPVWDGQLLAVAAGGVDLSPLCVVDSPAAADDGSVDGGGASATRISLATDRAGCHDARCVVFRARTVQRPPRPDGDVEEAKKAAVAAPTTAAAAAGSASGATAEAERKSGAATGGDGRSVAAMAALLRQPDVGIVRPSSQLTLRR